VRQRQNKDYCFRLDCVSEKCVSLEYGRVRIGSRMRIVPIRKALCTGCRYEYDMQSPVQQYQQQLQPAESHGNLDHAMQCNAMQCNAMQCNANNCNANNCNANNCNANNCNANNCNANNCNANNCNANNCMMCVTNHETRFTDANFYFQIVTVVASNLSNFY
jgi:uncharacterized protein YjbI with pentapeptide repeats